MESTKPKVMKTKLIIVAIIGMANVVYPQCAVGNLFSSSGNVGLGTGSPANKLHIVTCAQNGGIVIDQIGTQAAAGAAAISLKNSSNALGRHWMLASTGNGNNGNGGNFEIDDFGTGPYNPTTSAINRFFIEGATGNVGIGTIAPSELLHTTGGVRFQGLTTGGTGALSTVVADGTGKLWLGSSTGLGNNCGQSPNNLTSNYEVPLNNFNFYFTGNNIAQQQKVNVGIPCTTSFPGKFNVTSGVATDANGDSYGVYATNTNGATANMKTGIYGAAINSSGPGVGLSRGIHGYSSSTSWMAFGVVGEAGPALRAWGGRFEALNAGNDTNFGTQGLAYGAATNYGGYFDATGINGNLFSYGLYASAAGAQTNWAGYFVGNVNIIGNGWINGIAITSDRKFKKDITALSNVTEKILLLKPSNYTFKTEEFKNMNLPEGKQLGFIAQELEEVFPELVMQKEKEELRDRDGAVTGTIAEHKAINYIGLIPVLISGIQEQQAKIEQLSAAVNSLQKQLAEQTGGTTAFNEIHSTSTDFILGQNIPNPFTNETVIKYTIPGNVNNATMLVYDLSGKQITSFPLTEKGNSSITITSQKLVAGIYIYSIMADGKIMDSKRMVVADK